MRTLLLVAFLFLQLYLFSQNIADSVRLKDKSFFSIETGVGMGQVLQEFTGSDYWHNGSYQSKHIRTNNFAQFASLGFRYDLKITEKYLIGSGLNLFGSSTKYNSHFMTTDGMGADHSKTKSISEHRIQAMIPLQITYAQKKFWVFAGTGVILNVFNEYVGPPTGGPRNLYYSFETIVFRAGVGIALNRRIGIGISTNLAPAFMNGMLNISFGLGKKGLNYSGWKK